MPVTDLNNLIPGACNLNLSLFISLPVCALANRVNVLKHSYDEIEHTVDILKIVSESNKLEQWI
jgi:hypothetical protein